MELSIAIVVAFVVLVVWLFNRGKKEDQAADAPVYPVPVKSSPIDKKSVE